MSRGQSTDVPHAYAMEDRSVSRRQFVRTAAVTAALPALVSCAALPQTSTSRTASTAVSQRPLRVGLIGCGGRGTGAAIQALRADPDAVLHAAGDIFPDRLSSSLNAITQELGPDGARQMDVPETRRFAGFDSYQNVIDSGVDVVLLTSYPCFRPQHLRAAVDAGKHVFAEKPLAVDGPGIRSVLESAQLAARKRRSIVIGFCWRFNTGMAATFAQVNRSRIGRVRSAYSTYLSSTLSRNPRQPQWSDAEFQLRNWWHFTWISGDHIVEQAVHSVDRLLWAFNDEAPQRVVCLGGRAARSGPEHGNVYDHFSAVYEFSNNRRGFLNCRQIDSCPSDNSDYIIEAARGSATINGWGPTYELRDHDGRTVWSHAGDIPDMYQSEHNALFRAIRRNEPLNDCVRGAHSSLAAIMARMAAYTGQTITWEQALNSQESLVPESIAFGPMSEPVVAIPGQTKFK